MGKTWLAAAVVALVWTSSVAFADPVWVGDFETGNTSQYSLLNGQYISVMDGVVAQGSHAARIELHNDATWPNGLKRVELHHSPAHGRTGEGKTDCMAWSIYIPTTLSTDPDQNIGYWETDNSNQNLMDFVVSGDSIRFFTMKPNYKEHWSAAHVVTPATWHRVAICVLFSQNANTGAVNVWFDGQHVVTDAKAQTLIDGNDVFMQFGFLRGAIEFADVPTMYVDDAAEGDTAADVGFDRLPGVTPTPDAGPGDAGALDASASMPDGGNDHPPPLLYDSGTAVDAGSHPATGDGSHGVTGGCAAARGNGGTWWMLAAMALLLRRRRR